jgi:hypothetical protein
LEYHSSYPTFPSDLLELKGNECGIGCARRSMGRSSAPPTGANGGIQDLACGAEAVRSGERMPQYPIDFVARTNGTARGVASPRRCGRRTYQLQ